MEQAGVQLIAAGANVYIVDLKNATSATNGFVDTTEKGSHRVSAAGQIIIGGLRQIGKVAVDAFGQALKATASFLKDSVDLAGDFEQGMREFQSVAGQDVDTKGLERFKDLFLDLGKELPVSTGDVQKAAIEMVKGGIDPAIIAAGGLRQNIQFAAAAMKGDLVSAAEISAKLLGGWGEAGATAAEQAAFLTHSTDLLTKAANASTVDVKELALGIFNAQGIAKVAGVKFDDLTTTLAALAPRFESASTAGNSLKNMIARLQPTTKPAIAAMEGLGLITKKGNNQFYDAKGNFVGMSKAGQLLQDSLKGLTKQQQASVLQTIFGNDAMGAAAGLAELGADGYANMAAKMEKANGVAATAALIQGSFNTKLDNAKGSIEALQITIGTVLLPVLGDLLDNYITPAINAVTDWVGTITSATDPLLTFAQSIGAISPDLSNIAYYLIDLVRNGQDMGGWLATTSPLFQTFVGIVQDAIPVIQDIAGFIGDNLMPNLFGIGSAITVAVVPALLAATGAFLGVAAPVAAVIAAGALLYQAWQTDFGGMRTSITEWWTDTALPALQEVQAWLATNIPIAIKATADFWTTTLQPAIVTVIDYLRSNVFPVLADVAGWLKTTIPEAAKATADFWNTTLLPALTGVKDFLVNTAFPAFSTAVDWLKTNIPAAAKATADFWDNTLQPSIKKVVDYINNSVFPAFKDLADKYLKDVTKASNDFSDSWNTTMLPALQTVGNYMGQSLSEEWAKIDVWVAAVQKTSEFFAAFWNNILWPGLQDVGEYLGTHLTKFFSEFGEELDRQVGPALKGVSEWLGKITAGFDGTSKGMQDNIKWLQDLAQGFRDLKLPAWLTPGSPTPFEIALYGIGRALTTAVDPGLDAMRDGLKGVGAAVEDTDLIDALTSLGGDAMAGFVEGLESGIGDVLDVIGDTADTVEEAFRGAFDSRSPSQRMVPIGQSLPQGIMLGFEQEWPHLIDMLGGLADDLVQQVTDIADEIQGAIADSFSATASIDRQMAKNLDRLKDVGSDFMQDYIAQSLEAEQKIAAGFLDPKVGAAYYKMVSDNIFDTAALRKKIDEAQTQEDKDRLNAQLILISRAQDAEKSAFQHSQANAASPAEQLTSLINALNLTAGAENISPALTESLTALMFQLSNTVHRAAGGPVNAFTPYWVGEKGPELFTPGTRGMISPAATSQQLAARANTTNYNGQVGPTINMPIYTNNTPGAIQQSWAVMQASMP